MSQTEFFSHCMHAYGVTIVSLKVKSSYLRVSWNYIVLIHNEFDATKNHKHWL